MISNSYAIFRCKIPGLDNDTWDNGSPEHQALVKFYIPPSDTYPFDRCHLYDRDNSTVHTNTSIHVPMVKCKEWVYSTSIFRNTFTQQVRILQTVSWLYNIHVPSDKHVR